MRPLFIIISLLLLAVAGVSAQSTTVAPADTVEIYPEFPGGEEAMLAFISRNVNYPKSAIENNIQGKVVVSFVVDKDGSITYVRVMKKLNYALDQEAMRVVKSMPKWKPGLKGGKPVKVMLSVPIRFELR